MKIQTAYGFTIGNVRVDTTHISSKDIYSDGDIENELLQIAMKDEEENALARDHRWPILYHLSEARENLLSWIPIQENAKILEIRSGCGALTGLLCRKAERVDCVEISPRRAEISAWRHKERSNLIIHVGNINDMVIAEKFDYITLIGVLEYAGTFTHTKNPFHDLLAYCRNLLKPNGKLIIAIENRLGMKYWSGALEDHTGCLFDGILNYIDYKGIRTFSHHELYLLLKNAGFQEQIWRFPFPDYKLPLEIHSHNYLPRLSQLQCHTNLPYDRDKYEFFPENIALASIMQAGLYPEFTNSFLVICTADQMDPNWQNSLPQYVHFPDFRNRSYRIMTSVLQSNTDCIVRKQAMNSDSLKHLNTVYENIQHLGEIYGKEHVPRVLRKSDEEFDMEYISGPTLTEVMLHKLQSREDAAFKECLRFYYTHILRGEDIRETFHGMPNFSLSDRTYDIDINFDNICIRNNDFVLLDCEWLLPHASKAFILYRVLEHFYGNYTDILSAYRITKESLMTAVGIDKNNLALYTREQDEFSRCVMKQEIVNYRKKRIHIRFNNR